MRISTQWLQDWMRIDDPAELAHRLTMAGLEVDAIEPAAPAFSGVVVVRIEQCEPHPDADKLQVCRVNTGSETVQIVCGAPNARAGLIAPLATVGGVLPGDFKIKKAKLRGVESFGMLCSAKELGLSEDAAGLLELPEDLTPGQDIRDALALNDTIIEVDLTPNRSDCLGMVGIVRELSAVLDQPAELAWPEPVPADVSDLLEVSLEFPEACPRYCGRILRGVDSTATTPLWMQERLRRTGVRSLGPIVDVTNYVMMELGLPMHAFDLAKLDGGIRVRLARAGESLDLLNGDRVELRDDTLVIADQTQAVAMAGIMGGEPTSVSNATKDILLESAFFAPAFVAGKARSYGLHTDSSHRFERGVDPAKQHLAMERATQLILDICGGRPGPVVDQRAEAHLPKAANLRLRRARLDKVLGHAVPDADVERILSSLGFDVATTDDGWSVQAPSHRFDMAIEEDLIEEVARVYGYDHIPARAAAMPAHVQSKPEARVLPARIRRVLVDRGYFEAVTYSFVEPGMQKVLDPEHEPVALANPISVDLAVMRTSLWPGLLQAVRYNQNRQHGRIRLFETGLRFRGTLDECEQTPMIAGVITGGRVPEGWANGGDKVDFFDLKGDVEALIALAGQSGQWQFRAAEHPALHPGQCAALYRDDELVGYLGALHPAHRKTLDIGGDVFMFELKLQTLQAGAIPGFQPLSKFPSIRRDLAVLVDQHVSAADITRIIREAAGHLLRDLIIFDHYQGKGVPDGKKSVAIGLILQDSSRTLIDEDVEEVIAAVVGRLKQHLDAQLRE